PAVYSGKNKLFFFFAYEGLKETTNNTYTSVVETPAFRSSVIAARPNTVTARVLSASGVEPRITHLLTASCAVVNVPCQVVGNGLDVGSITGTYGTYTPSFSNPLGGGFDGIADLQLA